MNDQINPEPLNKTGKVMVALIILEVIVMWMFAIYAYLTLPQEVPVHFGFKGEPTRYGDKSTFLIVPAAFSIAPIIFLFWTKFRFTLINRINITKVSPEKGVAGVVPPDQNGELGKFQRLFTAPDAPEFPNVHL